MSLTEHKIFRVFHHRTRVKLSSPRVKKVPAAVKSSRDLLVAKYGSSRSPETVHFSLLLCHSHPCSRGTVYRLMRKYGIQSKRKIKWKATTNSKHNLPVAPNLLNQDFDVETPNTVWVSDITYNWTDEGWLYTAIIKDLCTKEIVGYAMDKRMTKNLVIKALHMALKRATPGPGLIFHSDRGSQYCSKAFRDVLEANTIRQSMSRKGNPYDNAPAENFFSCLKRECTNFLHFRTRRDAKQAIFEYIEIYYNRQRRHAALGWISPLKYKHQLAAMAA